MVMALPIPKQIYNSRAESSLHAELDALTENLNNLLAPLARLKSSSTLEELLGTVAPRYVGITKRMSAVLEGTPEEEKLINKEIFGQGIDHLHQLAIAKVQLFQGDDLQRFLGALSSFQGWTEWLFASAEKGVISIGPQISLVGEFALRATISIIVIRNILENVIPDWSIESLRLLCSAADRYMTKVEDGLLELTNPLIEEKVVPYRGS